MKRTKRTSDPKPTEHARTLTEAELAAITGGASAIEYGLLLAQPIR